MLILQILVIVALIQSLDGLGALGKVFIARLYRCELNGLELYVVIHMYMIDGDNSSMETCNMVVS